MKRKAKFLDDLQLRFLNSTPRCDNWSYSMTADEGEDTNTIVIQTSDWKPEWEFIYSPSNYHGQSDMVQLILFKNFRNQESTTYEIQLVWLAYDDMWLDGWRFDAPVYQCPN